MVMLAFLPHRFFAPVSFFSACVMLSLSLGLSGCASAPSDKGNAPLTDERGKGRNPHELLEKSRKLTFEMLGTPDLNRREGRTMQWQYRSDHCTLDLFFVSSSPTGRIKSKAHVQHFELRPSSSAARMTRAALQKCYARLVKERRKSARTKNKNVDSGN